MANETEAMELVFTWVRDKASELYPEVEVCVFDERAMAEAMEDERRNRVYCAVHAKSSSTDTKITMLELGIVMLSERDDFDKTVGILSEVVSEHNLKTVGELGGYCVFNTPYVSNKFVENGDSFRAEISVDGSFLISPGVQNTTLTVDGEGVFLLQSAIGIAGSNDPVVLGSIGIAKSQIAYYTRTYTIKIYNDLSSAFVQKCYKIWSEENLTPSTILFEMVITYGDGYFVTKRMYLQQLIQSSVIGSISTLELTFVEAG